MAGLFVCCSYSVTSLSGLFVVRYRHRYKLVG